MSPWTLSTMSCLYNKILHLWEDQVLILIMFSLSVCSVFIFGPFKDIGSYIWGFNAVILIEPYLCSQPMRCGQGTVLQCDKVCGALLNCAEHTCTQVCHSGACQPCQLQVQQGESLLQHSSIQCSDRNVSFHLGNLVLEATDYNVFIFFSVLLWRYHSSSPVWHG